MPTGKPGSASSRFHIWQWRRHQPRVTSDPGLNRCICVHTLSPWESLQDRLDLPLASLKPRRWLWPQSQETCMCIHPGATEPSLPQALMRKEGAGPEDFEAAVQL